jgi:hypothetical protein
MVTNIPRVALITAKDDGEDSGKDEELSIVGFLVHSEGCEYS